MLGVDVLTAIEVFRSFSAQLSLCPWCLELASELGRRFNTSGGMPQPYTMYWGTFFGLSELAGRYILPTGFVQECDRLPGQTRNTTQEANQQLTAKSGTLVLCAKGECTLSSSISACGRASCPYFAADTETGRFLRYRTQCMAMHRLGIRRYVHTCVPTCWYAYV